MMGETTKADRPSTRAMTKNEIMAAALSDPDNLPMTDEEWAAAKPFVSTLLIRHMFKLSPEEFSARYQIPLETLHAWEEGRSDPDAAARAYLRVIRREPEMVARALADGGFASPHETV
jgi:putative transcriptional regulator